MYLIKKSIFLNTNFTFFRMISISKNLIPKTKYLARPLVSLYSTESSPSKHDYYDIVVCGGGMVGAAMALALGQDKLFKNLKIALIDSAPEKKHIKAHLFIIIEFAP